MKKVLIIPFYISKNIADADYLSEGIVEELIDFISNLEPLTVFGRNLSLFLKEHPKSGQDLVKDFGVDYLIEGSITSSNEQTTLSIRLVKASTEEVLTARKSTLNLDEWTNQLRNEILEVFKIEFPSIGSSSVVENKTKVKELYLKGLYHWNRYTYEEMNKAIGYFKLAIKEDSEYSLGYSGLADCYSVIGIMGFEDASPAYEKSLEYVNKALTLNDKHSDSYLAASFINMFYQRDYDKAKANLDYAMGLNRNNSKVHHRLGFYYAYMLEFDLSEKHILKSIELDPLSTPQYAMLIRLCFYRRDYVKAMDVIEATLLIDPTSLPILELKGLVCLLAGNNESAISIFRECLEISTGNLVTYGYLSYALSASGFHDESRKVERLLDETTESKSNGNFDYAKMLVKLGRKDFQGFFLHLNKTKSAGLTYIIGDVWNNPIYSEIKKDPRYQPFLEWGNLDSKKNTFVKHRNPTALITIQSNTKEQLSLDPQDIAYIKGDGNYSVVSHYQDSVLTHSLLRITMKQLDEFLDGFEYLVRVHKSFIVNIQEDLTITGNAKGHFLECSYFPLRIPISRSKSSFVKDLLSARI